MLPFRAVENQLLRCGTDDAPAVGVCRSPVSRLFGVGVRRCADSVLIAAGDGDTCEADLELSRVTPLKVAATQPRQRVVTRAGQAGSPAGAMRSVPTRREAGKRARRFAAASSACVIRVVQPHVRRISAPGMCRPHASLLAATAREFEARAISRHAERRLAANPLVLLVPTPARGSHSPACRKRARRGQFSARMTAVTLVLRRGTP